MSEGTDGKARVARYYAAREQFESGQDGPELDELTTRYVAREARCNAKRRRQMELATLHRQKRKKK